MKYLALIGTCAALSASAVFAESVMPSKVMFDDGAVSASLSGAMGDPVEGRKVFANRKLGNCLACHVNADLDEQPFHGEVGPALDGAGSRWEEAELRGIVANAKMMFDGTIMPAFYIDAGYTRNLEKFEGKSILSAQQVEDVVAYLKTLTDE